MTSIWAKEDAKAVASPTITGEVPERVAMGTVIGPTAATVAPSLMKLVRIPVIKLVEIHKPTPVFRNPGNRLIRLLASHSAAPVTARPYPMALAAAYSATTSQWMLLM